MRLLAPALALCFAIAACAGSEDTTEGSGGSSGNAGNGGSGNSGGWPSGGTAGSAGSAGASGVSGTGGGTPVDPCAGQPDGSYCGSDLGGGADHGSVYDCQGGAVASASSCATGCEGGACKQAPSDPCASAYAGDGNYCGGSLAGGDPGTLYTCTGGGTSSTTSCSGGCQVNPPGTPDACASNDPCSGANGGNGPYCGSSLPGGDPGKLYTCTNQTTTGTQTCPSGCQVMPPGTPDKCSGADPCSGANGGNGPYCGGSLPGGDPNTLYTCTNLVTTGTQACPNGCQVMPPGTPDACQSSGGDPCSGASSGNGEYCGGSLSGGDANKLYTCVGGKTASVVTCSEGCQTNPPGTPDQCKSSSTGGCCVLRPPGVFNQGFTACGGGGSHYGIDYGANLGTPLYAGISGTVKVVLGFPNCYNQQTQSCSTTCYQSSFNYLRIKSDCGDPNDSSRDLYVYYLHIDSVPGGISDGVHVSQGEYVATVGNSGCSSGPHTHIEVVSVPKGQSGSLGSCSSVNPETRYCP